VKIVQICPHVEIDGEAVLLNLAAESVYHILPLETILALPDVNSAVDCNIDS
jgi:hypothetical protein